MEKGEDFVSAKELKDLELFKNILKSDYDDNSIEDMISKIYLSFPCIEEYFFDCVGKDDKRRLISMFEFYRRLNENERRVITPKDVFFLLKDIAKRRQEHFIVISLNSILKVIHTRTVFVGTLNYALIHPREVFADPINERASGIIIAHNHPSMDTTPSREDDMITKRLIDAGNILGISVYDHVIFSKNSFYSYKNEKPEFFN